MAKKTRRHPSLAFKAKVAWAVLRGEHSLPELAEQVDVSPNPSKA